MNQFSPEEVLRLVAALDVSESVLHDQTRITLQNYDYTSEGKNVEALLFRPADGGILPALLLIPGHGTTARNWIHNGVAFASAGYICMTVSQPGYGHSDGPADFVGPRTRVVLKDGFQKLCEEPLVDSDRMGIVGYSRGATAAILLAIELQNVRAVVLGAGNYDLKVAYEEAKIPGIRDRIAAETDMSEEALRDRSPIFKMESLQCPLLILHGEQEDRVLVNQAYLLRDRLNLLGKEFEFHTFPDRTHDIGSQNFFGYSADFLYRTVKSV